MELTVEKKEEIKGPFSYSGNKYRIWKKHLKDEFSKYSKIHEPFIGSGACLYNSKMGGNGIDIDNNVVTLHQSMGDISLMDKIEKTYKEYFPSGRDKDNYLKLRTDFNKSFVVNGTTLDNVHMLHILVQLSFNSLLRFSKNGFNVPFGMKEVDFDRIKRHQDIFQKKDIQVKKGNYYDLDLSEIDKENDIIYFDPPYIASKFQYGGWNVEDEVKLLNYIDALDFDNYKFVVSNTFLHRGVSNKELIEWSKKYNVKTLQMSYNAWAAAVKTVKKEKDTLEVIVSNIKF